MTEIDRIIAIHRGGLALSQSEIDLLVRVLQEYGREIERLRKAREREEDLAAVQKVIDQLGGFWNPEWRSGAVLAYNAIAKLAGPAERVVPHPQTGPFNFTIQTNEDPPTVLMRFGPEPPP